MAKVIKVLKTLRNNWKKSTFVAILGYYGVDYATDWHRTYLMMRDYGEEALVHGLRPLPSGAKNKHITLFLNPTSGNKKSKAKLEKYAEPLLHLAGFLVNVVKTERIDEARDLAGVIEKTNIIAVAGGDGTLFETITGLLRREDVSEVTKRFPIGIIPLGSQNHFAERLLNRKKEDSDEKFIAESTMTIVRHKIKAQDLMEITIAGDEEALSPVLEKKEQSPESIEEVSEGTEKKGIKPFYSLAGICIGQFRDAQKLKDDMPSLFPNYFSTFLSLYKAPEECFKAEIRYVPPCDGCVSCKVEEVKAQPEVVAKVQPPSQPSMWSRIFSIFQPYHAQAQSLSTEDAPMKQLVVGNPDCGKWSTMCVETSELNFKPAGDGKILIEIGKKFSKTDFMIEGLKRFRHEPTEYSKVLECREIELAPIAGQEFLSIDGEEFDMKKIKIKVLRNRVHFFTV